MKEDRQARWQRRKARTDGRTAKQGMVAGNARYNGKGAGGLAVDLTRKGKRSAPGSLVPFFCI